MPNPSVLRHRSGTSAAPAAAPPSPPHAVRVAFALWVTAVAAGGFETVLAVGRLMSGHADAAGQVAVGLAVRLPVFTAALLVAGRMRRGRRWARIALTLGLGVLGTASMVVQPIGVILHHHSLAWELAHSGALDLAFGASRVVHVASVLTAVALMFLPAANRYFRPDLAAVPLRSAA